MFADVFQQDHAWRHGGSLKSRRAHEKERRQQIYGLADSIYMAVHLKRPKQEIDGLLRKLERATRRKEAQQ